MKVVKILEIVLIAGLIACGPAQVSEKTTQSGPYAMPNDSHSFARPGECVTTHLSLDLTVNFDRKIIEGTATHTIRNAGADTFIVDINGLGIQGVTVDGVPVTSSYGPETEHLGKALKVPVSDGSEKVEIRYTTQPDAAALGWLDPVQTAGKTAPFLYTQGQAILTRTWIPLQDSPGIRFTYDATIHVQPGLMAAMSATNPQERSADGVYQFKMDHPVPGYLIALAVGDFDFAAIGPRTGVYAEPPLLEKAKYEFGEMERMLEIAEGLYGPYLWDRYDVIVLPPSFPFGGMENPKLTFATPTIIAGDRSLVSLIAHELAHSWSGNLVTNATWDDFWLNEGFTVYFENRIMEALYGAEYARMLALLGHQDLNETIEDLSDKPADTHLHLDLEGRDPDEGMTSIAYDKGALFLKRLEEAAGREKFDAFLLQYFEEHKFQSMSTAQFLEYLDAHLVEPLNLEVQVEKWVYGPGIPEDSPVINSDRFEKVDDAVRAYTDGTSPSELSTGEWTTHEWLHFIRHLPADLSSEQLQGFDAAFGFKDSGNSEIAAAWYEHVLRTHRSGDQRSYAVMILPEIEAFLTEVGRRKFLMPIYRAMKESGLEEDARRIFRNARQNYHSVSDRSLADLLEV